MAIKTIPYKDHRAIVDALTRRLDELEAEMLEQDQKNAALRKHIDYLTDHVSEQTENEAKERIYSLDKNNEPQTLADILDREYPILEEAERLEDEKKEDDAVRSLDEIEQDDVREMTLQCRVNTLEEAVFNDELSSTVDMHTSQIDDALNLIGKLEDLYTKSLKKITALEKSLASEGDHVAADDLGDEVYDLQRTVNDLAGDLDGHEHRLSGVERELEKLQNKVNGK